MGVCDRKRSLTAWIFVCTYVIGANYQTLSGNQLRMKTIFLELIVIKVAIIAEH